jgi:hypothetical protein
MKQGILECNASDSDLFFGPSSRPAGLKWIRLPAHAWFFGVLQNAVAHA